MCTHDQRECDLIVFLLSAVSSTAVAFPVWTYAVYGKMIGYDPVRLILVISAGSTLGSYSTYIIVRFFGDMEFFRKRFPGIYDHKWAAGGSDLYLGIIIFAGSAFLLSVDMVYAFCGIKKYPGYLFNILVFLGKVVTCFIIIEFWDLIRNIPFLNLF